MTYDEYIRKIRNQPNLVGCWLFTKGDALHDYSGHNNHLGISGASWERGTAWDGGDWDSDRIWAESQGYEDEGINNYLLFGGDDVCYIASTAALSITGNLSILAWIKTSNSQDQTIISKYYADNNEKSYLLDMSSGNLRLTVSDDGSNSETLSSSATANDEKWHLIGAVYDSINDSVVFSIDRRVETAQSFTIETGSIHNNNAEFNIGGRRQDDTNYFVGGIGEVSLFNRILHTDEILKNFDLGKTIYRR